MELLLRRTPAVDHAILGDLYVGGVRTFVSLERQGVEIPAGRYQVVLSISARASRGALWSPDPEHRLPELLGVPLRSGIRLHALNRPEETEGCIGVGWTQIGTMAIGRSRDALTALMAAMVNQVCWLTVDDPPRPGAETVNA